MENNIGFKEYLISKKIDFSKFKLDDRNKYDALKSVFMEMHPDSFTAQKLFLINPLRRQYQLVEEVTANPVVAKAKVKPIFKK